MRPPSKLLRKKNLQKFILSLLTLLILTLLGGGANEQ